MGVRCGVCSCVGVCSLQPQPNHGSAALEFSAMGMVKATCVLAVLVAMASLAASTNTPHILFLLIDDLGWNGLHVVCVAQDVDADARQMCRTAEPSSPRPPLMRWRSLASCLTNTMCRCVVHAECGRLAASHRLQQPTCSPSRAALLSARYPYMTGICVTVCW